MILQVPWANPINRHEKFFSFFYNLCSHLNVLTNVCMYSHTYSKSMDQPGKVANPARGQLNRKNEYSFCPRSRLRIWSRETGSAIPSVSAYDIQLHTQAGSGTFLRDSSRIPRRRPFIHLN